MKHTGDCGCDHYAELATHFVLSAIANPNMLVLKTEYQRLNEKRPFLELVERGCDPDILRACMASSRALLDLVPVIEVDKLRNLADHIEAVLDGFGDLMPSRSLPMLTEGNPSTFQLVPISEDFHVSEELRSELERKLGACRHILEYAKTNSIPRRDDLRQLAHAWPSLYAKDATGSYNFDLVGDLLAEGGFAHMSQSSLSRSMGSVREKFAFALPFMVPAIKQWARTEAYINLNELSPSGQGDRN